MAETTASDRELAQFLMAFPEVARNPNARREIIYRTLDKYDIKGKDSILPSEKDIQEAQEQMMKKSFEEEMNQRMGQGGGGGGQGTQAPPTDAGNLQGMGGLL